MIVYGVLLGVQSEIDCMPLDNFVEKQSCVGGKQIVDIKLFHHVAFCNFDICCE